MQSSVISIAAGPAQMSLLRHIRTRGLTAIGVDHDPGAPGFALCDEAVQESTHDPSAVIKRLTPLSKRYHFTGVVCGSSGMPVVTAAKVADQFGLPGPSPTAATTLTDKARLIPALHDRNIPCPRVCVVSAPHEQPSFGPPWFVKPSSATGSHTGMTLVHSNRDLPAAIGRSLAASNTGQANVERYITGTDLLCVDWVCKGRIIPVAVIQELTSGPPCHHGLGWIIPASARLASRALACRELLVQGFALEGLVLTALRCTEHAARIYEVHLDLGGDGIPEVLLPAAYDYDLFADAVTLATGGMPAGPRSEAVPTALCLLTAAELRGRDPVELARQSGGTGVSFPGLDAPMDEDRRTAAILYQAGSRPMLMEHVAALEKAIHRPTPGDNHASRRH